MSSRQRRRLGNYNVSLIVSLMSILLLVVTPVDAFNNLNINTHTLQRNQLSNADILSRSVHRLQYIQPPSTRRQVVHLSMSSTESSDESNSNKSKSRRSTIFTAATLGLLALTSTSTIANAAKKVDCRCIGGDYSYPTNNT